MKHQAPLLVGCLAILAPSAVHAETYFEFGGGLTLPVSDDDYADFVDPSIALAARIGGGGPVLGGMFSVEWAPLAADPANFSLNRFRLLGHLVFHHRITPKAEFVGRVGLGIDVIHSHYEVDTVIGRVEGSDSDAGLAIEMAGGVWFRVGTGTTQVGVELALPIGIHNKDGNALDPDDQTFDYTSIDLQILGGVRLRL